MKVVIDDIEYEKYCVQEYVEHLEENIARLKEIDKYAKKANEAKKEKDRIFYENGMKVLFEQGETFDNYSEILTEYENAYETRNEILKKLDAEIKKIKKMKV